MDADMRRAFIIEEPFRSNYQFLVRLPYCDNQNEAFLARSALETWIQRRGDRINNQELRVSVGPDAQRRQWLQAVFRTHRAISAVLGTSSSKLETEIKSFSIYHADLPTKPVARLNKFHGEMQLEWKFLESQGAKRSEFEKELQVV